MAVPLQTITGISFTPQVNQWTLDPGNQMAALFQSPARLKMLWGIIYNEGSEPFTLTVERAENGLLSEFEVDTGSTTFVLSDDTGAVEENTEIVVQPGGFVSFGLFWAEESYTRLMLDRLGCIGKLTLCNFAGSLERLLTVFPEPG